MTTATQSPEAVLSVRMSRLRDMLVAKIEAQRTQSNMAVALVGISETIRGVVASVDDMSTVTTRDQEPHDGTLTLGAKRAARQVAAIKARTIDTKGRLTGMDAASVGRAKPAAREDCAVTWATGIDETTFVLDLKQAIQTALGQS
jgi:hypothetical protein